MRDEKREKSVGLVLLLDLPTRESRTWILLYVGKNDMILLSSDGSEDRKSLSRSLDHPSRESSQKWSDPRNSDVEEDFLLEQRQALIHEPVHEHQHLECHASYAGYPWSNSPPLAPATPPTTSFMPPVAHASASEVSSS
ncbi:hypothetical protein JHK87_047489 [Glycine soja]|nr:hypothetical protein JHK87_047489 [Glycine soja]